MKPYEGMKKAWRNWERRKLLAASPCGEMQIFCVRKAKPLKKVEHTSLVY